MPVRVGAGLGRLFSVLVVGTMMAKNVAMQSIKVTELKAHLSRYLRQASRGERITVRDRDDPIAELGPARGEPLSWRDRLVREGRLRPGTQDWGP